MRVVSFFMCLVFLASCSKSVDEVDNNETVAFEGEVRGFNPEEISGTYVSDCDGEKYTLTFEEGDFELAFNNKKAKGEISFLDDGYTIGLNTKNAIPFQTIKIEDEDFLVVLDENFDCIFEKTN